MEEKNRYKFIQWDITTKCNLNCIQCRSETFYGSGKVKKDPTTEEAFKILDNLYDNGIRRIHVLGGEPFTRKDMTKIAKYAFDKGIVMSINTNGTLITEEVAQNILDSSVYMLTFSLDGPTAEINDSIRGEGVFDKVTGAIKMLDQMRRKQKKYLRMILTPVVMSKNINHLHGMLDIATELNVNNLIFTGLRKMGGAVKDFDSLEVSKEDNIKLIERVVAHRKEVEKKYGHCVHIQPGIVGNPILLYINKKFGTDFPIDPSGCDAGYSKGFLQPDGALFPCQDLAKIALEEKKRKKAEKEGTEQWMERDEVKELRKKIYSKDTYKDYKPCYTCPLLLTFCTPCPINGIQGNKQFKEDCAEEFKYARKKGVNVIKEIQKEMVKAFQHKVLIDPYFRKSFLQGDETLFEPFNFNNDQKKEVETFREKIVDDMVSTVCMSLERSQS